MSAPRTPGAPEIPLDQLPAGRSGLILTVGGDPSIARRLMELGLVPGTHVQLLRLAPLGDPIELSVRGVHLSVRRSEAAQIYVSPR